MKNSKVLKTFLFITGLIATGIGAALTFIPVDFLGTSGIDLGNQVNLLSEVRAPGGALLASGLLILSGIFVPSITFTSTLLSTLIFFSYGIGRVVSMAIDGMPAQEMVAATVLEFILGLAGLVILQKYRKS